MDSKFVGCFFGKKSKNKTLNIDPKAACDSEIVQQPPITCSTLEKIDQ
jgi:hypothetical protein